MTNHPTPAPGVVERLAVYADWLDDRNPPRQMPYPDSASGDYPADLRALLSINAALVEAMEKIHEFSKSPTVRRFAREAILKATGGQP
jgi:hypothetical protein